MLPPLKFVCFFFGFLTLKIAKYYPKLVQALIVMKLGIWHINHIFSGLLSSSSGNDSYLKHHASSDLSGTPSQHLCGHLWHWDLYLCFKPDILLLLYKVSVTVVYQNSQFGLRRSWVTFLKLFFVTGLHQYCPVNNACDRLTAAEQKGLPLASRASELEQFRTRLYLCAFCSRCYFWPKAFG